MIGQDQHAQPAPAARDLALDDPRDALELAERGEHLLLQPGACAQIELPALDQPVGVQDRAHPGAELRPEELLGAHRKAQRALGLLLSAERQTARGQQQTHPFLLRLRTERLGKREHGREIVGVFQQLFALRLRIRSEGRPQHFRQDPFRADLRGCGLRARLILGEHLALVRAGVVEIDIVLMRAERLLRHQLGHEDLRVDGAAHADIALPLGRAAVIGRRRGQRDHGDLAFERIKESFQRFLPFAAQMMRLVEADRADPQLLYGICPLRRAVRVRLRSHVQRLIGDRADRGFFVKRFGEVILQRFALRQEQLAEALAPLPPYGHGGGEDQRRHARTADELEAQHGLAAARRGHDVDPPVGKILVRSVEDLLLITAEDAAEGDAGKDVFHAFSPFPEK